VEEVILVLVCCTFVEEVILVLVCCRVATTTPPPHRAAIMWVHEGASSSAGGTGDNNVAEGRLEGRRGWEVNFGGKRTENMCE
jgi:hypothetical protein